MTRFQPPLPGSPVDRLAYVLLKDLERYIFVYEDEPESRREVLRRAGRFASDPDLSFTWYDAAVMSQKIRGAIDGQAPVSE